ncbi:NTPase KAP family P-loop domain-containing protein 1-like [Macrotis lagotis]|uniref:NTPase KAP family P-loop domain-containing protein 1-like n=1 Tax=Macrotis lagotis TaxID=92651 RepID=UPI003D69C228
MSDKASKFGMESESLIKSSGMEPSSPISETSFNSMNNKEPLHDEVYCKKIGKILHYVKTPVTVGLYGPCRHRLNRIMVGIQNIMIEAKTKEESFNSQCVNQKLKQFFNLMLLLFKISMCVPKEADKTKTKTEYIFVPFKAWEFVGSDFLWAGLVTNLYGTIKKKYWLPLIFYKLFGIPVQDPKEVSKKSSWGVMRCHLKQKVFLVLVIILIFIGLCSFVFDLDTSDTMKTLSIPAVPISIMTMWSLGRVTYKFYQNSQKSINKLMNNTKCSNQLGFMHSVKVEIEVLTKFLHVLGVYNKEQIKVVLQITHLDACPPEKVLDALEALRILLSDPEAPFISILAVDSKVLAESVEKSQKVGSLPGSGYQYLSQLITLPFSLPHMNKEDKKNLLDEIKLSKEDLEADFTHDFKAIITILKEDKFAEFLPNNQAHMEQVVYTSWITLELIKQKSKDSQQTLHIEEVQSKNEEQKAKWQKKKEEVREDHLPDRNFREVIAWVLLANEWPFQVNWLLQCAEDTNQWRKICNTSKEQNDPEPSGTKLQSPMGFQGCPRMDNAKRTCCLEAQDSIKLQDTLEEAYSKSVTELKTVKKELKKLMELDGDPEIFLQMLQFLNKEFNFTVNKALEYWEITANLDTSLKRHMELIRSSQTLVLNSQESIGSSHCLY